MALVPHVKALVDSFGDLTAQHIKLAKVELQDDARYIGIRVGILAGLAPLILVGYGFLCVAAALALRTLMTVELAFMTVGLVNLLGAVLGMVVAGKQLAGRKVLNESATELQATALVVRRQEEGS